MNRPADPAQPEFEFFRQSLMQIAGVQAVGEGIHEGKPCLHVYFDHEASLKAAVIPTPPRDIVVIKIVSGKIQPLD